MSCNDHFSLYSLSVSRRIIHHYFSPQMLPKLTILLWAAIPIVLSQSNYASQGNSIEYQPGLPPSTVLDGKVTKLDDILPIIFLNRTKASLNCGQGSMEVELKFEEPFYGVAYADFDRNSACIFKGRGATTAKLELPLKGILSYFYILYFCHFFFISKQNELSFHKSVKLIKWNEIESYIKMQWYCSYWKI